MKWILFIIIFATLLPSCTRFRDIEFVGIDTAKITRLGLNKSQMQLNLIFHNPNKMGATLAGGTGQAWIARQFAGNFSLEQVVKIPANSNFSVPVNVSVNLKDLLKNAVEVALSDSMEIKLDGEALLQKSGIKKHIPLRYYGKKPTKELTKNLKF